MRRAARLGIDDYARRLSPQELAEQRRCLPALQAWTAYLDKVPARRAFEDAEAEQAPVVVRHTGSPLYAPLAACPAYALEWARRNDMGGKAGTGILLSFADMIDALDFMRAPRYESFRPVEDVHDRRRRDGFWRVTSEVHARLRAGNYTPSLAPLPGRVRQDDRRPMPVVARRDLALREDPGRALTLLRHYLQATPVTALYGTALDEGRPLVSRPPGRPHRSLSTGPTARPGEVLVHVDALVEHTFAAAAGIGFSPLSRGEVTAMLRSYVSAQEPGRAVLEPVDFFGTLDGGRIRRARLWWRVQLRPLGLPGVEPEDLMGEVEAWRRRGGTADRPQTATGREPVTDAVVEVDPAWEDDPEYRDSLGLPPKGGDS